VQNSPKFLEHVFVYYYTKLSLYANPECYLHRSCSILLTTLLKVIAVAVNFPSTLLAIYSSKAANHDRI
jgi:hypothetical protein